MHIRSVVHIVKNCTQLRRLGVHGYQHITNSPFHQLSTEYIQGYERNQFSEPMSDTMCSTTFELENLDKLVEASESPWLLENTVAVKSGDEGDVDTGSTLSSVSTEDSDSDSLGMVPSDLPAASAQESGKAGAFIFEYQSAASAYNLAKQVAQTEISSPRILEGWAVEEAEDIEYTGAELYEASPSTFMSTSSAYRRPIYSRGYSGSSFSRRPFVSRNSISQHYPSRESPSPSNQWQTDSFGLQAGKSQSGDYNTSTYQDMDTTDWQRGSPQDDSKESESGASQQTDHRGGWRQQPRNPQFYTMEFGNSTEEQQHQYQRPNHTVGDTEKKTLQMSESQTTTTSDDVEVEVGEGSTEGWVDYSRWVQASRAETVERHIPSEQASEYYCSSQSDLAFAADEQKGDVSMLSSPSAVTTNQVTATDEPVLVDISESSVSQEVVTGISQVFGDNFDFAALSLQQPFQEENDKAGVDNVVEKKTAQGTLIDLSISDEDDVSTCVPKSPYPSSYIEATETGSLSSQTPGLISSDLSCDTMPSVLHTHTSLSPTVTDSGHSDISIPEDVASVLTDDTSASMNAPKPLDLGFLDSSLPKKADHFGFGLEDTKNWLKDLAERQMQSRVA
ncbi:hypothetical protein BGW42_000969 [Actinomortierella wolfii]|nr:hypothetical protein BGW42_000969 [Actinomortierella wolfii]